MYEDQENDMMNSRGEIARPGSGTRRPLMAINSVTTSSCADAVDMLEGDNFAKALECTVNVSYLRLTKPKKVA